MRGQASGLRPLAWLYFDKAYYLKTYPEVVKTGMDPFDHYMSIGWREGKNPRADFDTRLYQRLYFGLGQTKIGLSPLQYHMRTFLHFKTEPTYDGDIKKAVPLKKPKYYLTLVAVFRNEAPYLKEWIEFYRLQGVEHFYLYNHLSKDSYKEVLSRYMEEGIVELHEVISEPQTLKEWHNLQISVYEETAKRAAQDIEWLIVVDTDEFLYPTQALSLKAALLNYNDVACLSVPWQIFGSGNTQRLEQGHLLIEDLIMASPKEDTFVKGIVKPRYVSSFTDPHFPVLKQGYAQVTEDKTYFQGTHAPKVTHNFFKLNHYWARDWTFFKERKLSRVHIVKKNLTVEEQQKAIHSKINENVSNSIKPETDILRFVPELKKRMGFTP
ncbi:MAG: glycosyltransferase family 92 protein [Alphaproteobacteria bacterium]|nr:glycosyltransferase family 92 protein [Alphaproteobacteria bacterium]